MKATVLSAVLLASLTAMVHAEPQQPDILARWSFDSLEGLGVTSGQSVPPSLAEGVQGRALVFDGYGTEVLIEPEKSPVLGDHFTISAWVAPQEYSWNLSAIINRQRDFQQGWFFGINQLGQLVGSVATDLGWKTCVSENPLPLLKWSAVAMVCDADKGISLYINGEKVGEKAFSGKLLPASDVETCIGRTQVPMTPALTERKTSQAVKSCMRFDGLIDELEILGRALTDAEIREAFQGIKVANIQPLQYRRMPSGSDEPRPFGAYYTKLRYSPGWDACWQGSDMPDIVVRFDNSPVKLVFWRGTGYIPAFVSENGIWMADQSLENWGTGECFEAMGDKQCRYSHVRLIENTPARVVIHWRCALASISHKIFAETDGYPGNWADEYWTAYPDGVVVRNQVLWKKGEMRRDYQFQETIFMNQPGTKPQDNVEFEAISFMDMDGKTADYSWAPGTPGNVPDGAPSAFPEPKFKVVEMINFKSKFRPFSIYRPERVTFPFRFGWVKGYSTFPCWNHWPVSQIPSDGRKAQAPDKPSHTSLAGVNSNQEIMEGFPDGSLHVRALRGMTNAPIKSLLPLARSWNSPPTLKVRSGGFTSSGYDPYQRAYLLEKQSGGAQELSCDIAATPESPIVNLCLVIKKWGSEPASVLLNGRPLSAKRTATGYVRNLEGDDLVVWLEVKSTEKTSIAVRPSVTEHGRPAKEAAVE